MKTYLLLLSLAILITQTGCVTGQRTFAVPVPTGPAVSVTKGSIYISSVTDNRAFQNKPSDPSIPSIDGDVTTLSPAQKDRMIGRQRNGFGKALGDIALSDNDTVTKRVRALVEEALRRKGYRVTNEPAADTSVAISVDEFWAWMAPGFFALTFEAKIGTSLTLKSAAGSANLTVKGHGLNHGQVVKDGNWLEAFEPAFEQFIANLSTEIDKASLQPTADNPVADTSSSLYGDLRKLDELRRDKILTEEEFQAQKKKLLEKR